MSELTAAQKRSEMRSAIKRIYWIVRSENERLREDGCHIDAEINDDCWELIVKSLLATDTGGGG